VEEGEQVVGRGAQGHGVAGGAGGRRGVHHRLRAGPPAVVPEPAVQVRPGVAGGVRAEVVVHRREVRPRARRARHLQRRVEAVEGQPVGRRPGAVLGPETGEEVPGRRQLAEAVAEPGGVGAGSAVADGVVRRERADGVRLEGDGPDAVGRERAQQRGAGRGEGGLAVGRLTDGEDLGARAEEGGCVVPGGPHAPLS
jgi:hypothetical protein